MKEMVEELKTQRESYDKTKEEYATALDEFKIAHQDMIQNMEDSKLAIVAISNEISKAALKQYDETKNNKIYPGIGIRVMKKLEYEQSKAMAWAKEHNLALTLDKHVFENHAKAEALDFVKEVEVPKATISASL